MWKYFVDTFAVIGGSGIVYNMIKWLGDVQANRIKSKDDHELSKSLEDFKAKISKQINQQNTAFNLYFTGQFDIYNKLWSSIVDLEESVDLLWEGVDRKRFNSFISAVKKAKTHVRKAAPFIDEQHYNLIDNFFNMIDEYQIGKERILHFENMNDDIFNRSIDEINEFVERNRITRENIHIFATICLQDFRNKLRG